MHYFIFLLTTVAILTTSCFKKSEPLASREDDKIRADLLAEIKQLEVDGQILDNQIKLSRERIQSLGLSPKMVDIAKRDMFSKEKYYQQIDQQISYLKIKVNQRDVIFARGAHKITQKKLEEEFESYSLNKKANPSNYPWRQQLTNKGAAQEAPKEEKKAHH